MQTEMYLFMTMSFHLMKAGNVGVAAAELAHHNPNILSAGLYTYDDTRSFREVSESAALIGGRQKEEPFRFFRSTQVGNDTLKIIQPNHTGNLHNFNEVLIQYTNFRTELETDVNRYKQASLYNTLVVVSSGLSASEKIMTLPKTAMDDVFKLSEQVAKLELSTLVGKLSSLSVPKLQAKTESDAINVLAFYKEKIEGVVRHEITDIINQLLTVAVHFCRLNNFSVDTAFELWTKFAKGVIDNLKLGSIISPDMQMSISDAIHNREKFEAAYGAVKQNKSMFFRDSDSRLFATNTNSGQLGYKANLISAMPILMVAISNTIF